MVTISLVQINTSMQITEITKPITRNISKELQGFAKYLTTGPKSFKEIADQLKKSLAEIGLDVNVGFLKSPHVDSGDMNMNAYYDPEADEQEDDAPFGIDLVFSEKDKTVDFSDEGIQTIITRIDDVLQHEIIHQKQHQARDWLDGQQGYVSNKGREIEYMSRPDEIEAYAKNIADELTRHAGSKKGAIDLLKNATNTAKLKNMEQFISPNLFAYFALFGFDTSHPVIKRLLKKSVEYLQL